VAYQGSPDVAELEIGPGSTVSAQISGANSGTTGRPGLLADARSGADVFAHLISLRQHLLAGDTEAIASTDRAALTTDQDHLLGQLAESGALQARLEVAASAVTRRTTDLRGAYSQEADANFAQTIEELTITQTAYRAALQTGADLLQTSLMDYLR
jgi:flagellar hook-associated protein 3 FlgL